MDLYNSYGDKLGKKKINKIQALKKMKENELLLMDNLSWDYHESWLNIFGKERPRYGWSYIDDKEIPFISGHIYIIRNVVTGMAYIGQTDNIIKRKTTHLTQLKNIKHENADMQVDSLLFGLNSFTFGIVEFAVESKDLLSKEKEWIKYFNTEHPNGYNAPYNDRVEFNQRDAKHYIKEFLKMKEIRDSEMEHGKILKEKIDNKLENGKRGWGMPGWR